MGSKRNSENRPCELWLKIFEIDIEQIKKILKVVEERPEEQKGMQPQMTYECFLRHAGAAKNTNTLCLTCKHYDGCKTYLGAARVNSLVKPN
jgi:hypothetical protein